jgi:hypothetical protein
MLKLIFGLWVSTRSYMLPPHWWLTNQCKTRLKALTTNIMQIRDAEALEPCLPSLSDIRIICDSTFLTGRTGLAETDV